MKNFVQPGDVITLPAPAGGIKSGAGMVAGKFFGVASTDAAEGAPVEAQLTGVFDLPCTGGPIGQGDAVGWDNAAKKIVASGGVLVGAVTEAVGSGGTVARVRLNGIALA